MKKLGFLTLFIFTTAITVFSQNTAVVKTKIQLPQTIELMVMDLEKTEKYYLDNFDFEKLEISEDLHQIKRYLVSSNGKWLILSWGRMKPIDATEEAHVFFTTVSDIAKNSNNLTTVVIKTDPEGYKIKIN